MRHPFDDTIAAIATPPGQSGIGIVRVSGPQAVAIADAIFRPASSDDPPSVQGTFTTRYGHVSDGEEVFDEVLLTVMRAPRTYTTQDVVEINCHGGAVPLRRTLELVLRRGARLADPGEFTKRAFFFGRVDLAQAEAVADVIGAQTEAAHRAAMHHLSGGLSRRIREYRDRLMELAGYVEASIDFGEDDIDFLTREQLRLGIDRLAQDMRELLASAEAGRALREGVRAAIVGRPNVGKSSLMNALLREDRVIVTPHPGTTRDVVEETVCLGGFPVTLADTAGLREPTDEIEEAGVGLARSWIERADLVLLVIDGSEALRDEDRRLLDELPAAQRLIVVNKTDLPQQVCDADLGFAPDTLIVHVSALTGEGLGALEEAVARMTWSGDGSPGAQVIVTNVRHKHAIECAAQALERCLGKEAQGVGEEVLAEDLRVALDALGEITGDTTREDVINDIFARFCIGK
ncbi:MAG: tRNA uridine-5-carboxymethylaminomethyl(34) synthesis GTPase MnmE [Armatimonadetes bacterium]|nr:tRNA uridine-5-carboxymethylaminomethyl(34) synthesis GTPase MnmE [Armatimonadota bacterium]